MKRHRWVPCTMRALSVATCFCGCNTTRRMVRDVDGNRRPYALYQTWVAGTFLPWTTVKPVALP